MKKMSFLAALAWVCLYILNISVSVQYTVNAWREVLK